MSTPASDRPLRDDDGPGDKGGEPESTLKDRRLEERAATRSLAALQYVRIRILKRLVGYIDPEHADGAKAKPRTVIAATRAILGADRLNLDQQRLDQAAGETTEQVDRDVIAQAEQIRQARQARLAATTQGEAGGPA